MKKIKIFLITMTLVLALGACGQKIVDPGPEKTTESSGQTEAAEPKKLFDYVYDLGTLTELDYEYANKYFQETYDNWGGMCTAVAKNLEDGTTLIGRNMDLNISNKCAYVFRTKEEGLYETINTMYTFRDISPDYEEFAKNGMSEEFRKVLPFMADDVLNTEGLFMEINMRQNEDNEDGSHKFGNSGTNPESDTRVYVFELPRYVGEHCANIEEALEYVKTLDIYTKDGYWNYSFLLGDATGRYGVMEIADNQIFWNDGQQAQTNFYVTEELAEKEEFKLGTGRYDYVMAHIDEVKNQDDMLALMKQVNFSLYYEMEDAPFDYRSEEEDDYVHNHEWCMDEANREAVHALRAEENEQVRAMTRQEKQDKNEYWESSFTEVINCQEKTLFIRFFEDDAKTMTLSFE